MDSESNNNAPGLILPQAQVGQGPALPATDSVPQQLAGQPMPSGPVDDDAAIQEQEWVDKAKAIVEQTKNDPFKESLELSKVKANFLKARYNKDIKVSEDHS